MRVATKKTLSLSVLFGAAICSLLASLRILFGSPAHSGSIMFQLCPKSVRSKTYSNVPGEDPEGCADLMILVESLNEIGSLGFTVLFSFFFILAWLGVFVNNNWEPGDERIVEIGKPDG